MTTTVQSIVIIFLAQSTISQIFCGDELKLEIPYQPYLNAISKCGPNKQDIRSGLFV
jgi:hypothetical protein